MRGLATVAAFVVFSLSVQAQMRMGRPMPAARGGFGSRSGTLSRGSGSGFHGQRRVPFHRFSGAFFHQRFRSGHFRHHRGSFFSDSFGFSPFGLPIWYDYPSFYSPYSYPMVSDASDYYPAMDGSYVANAEASRRIEERLDRLEERLSRLVEEQRVTSSPLSRSSLSSEANQGVAERSPATILVFRDKHAEEVSNYAVVGSTMWVFTEERARKIRVADLDLEATVRQNGERGIDFRITK